jgi:ribosomal protein L12E/L44/L45/RPP1/RPP2
MKEHNKIHINFEFIKTPILKTLNTMNVEVDLKQIQQMIDDADEKEFAHLLQEAEMIMNHPDCWA